MNLKVVTVVIIFFLIGGILTFSQNSYYSSTGPTQPCEESLTYRIGDIDHRYNITKEQLTEIMIKVEDLWATALDKDLLDYDKNGRVVVNLVYSENQKRTDEERSFSKEIEIKTSRIEILKQEYKQYSDRYKEKRAEFQSLVDEYNRKVDSYKNYIEQRNSRNATAQRKERDIERLKSKINREQQDLESLRQQTNAKSQQLNELVEEQNKMVAEYNAQFSNPTKFDQGRYIKQGKSEKINIYQFTNNAELKTVLAHESGHAFGLDHVDNPESVMYEMMAKQNIFNLQLTKEDIAAIKDQCSD